MIQLNYMKEITGEFSFILKPSKHGVGVFATHNIKKDTYLRLFGDEKLDESKIIIRSKKEVPKLFQDFCMERKEGELICPEDFGEMPVGWYLNHSNDPNAYHKDFNFYSLRNIKEGEEILIDYNSLEEPEDSKEDYYIP